MRRRGRSSNYRLEARPRAARRRRLARACSSPSSPDQTWRVRPRRRAISRQHERRKETTMTTILRSCSASPSRSANLDKPPRSTPKLLGTEGKRHPGARHYFDCGGVILAVLDPIARRAHADAGPEVAVLRRRRTSTPSTRARRSSARSRRTRCTASRPATVISGHGASARSTSSIRGATTCASWKTERSILKCRGRMPTRHSPGLTCPLLDFEATARSPTA